jgi:hypothetical protein
LIKQEDFVAEFLALEESSKTETYVFMIKGEYKMQSESELEIQQLCKGVLSRKKSREVVEGLNQEG